MPQKKNDGGINRFLKVVSGLVDEVAEDFRRGPPAITREQAIDFVGGFAGPVKGPGSLRLALKAGRADSGGKSLSFIVRRGKEEVADLDIFIRGDETKAFVDSIFSRTEQAGSLGHRDVGGILNQLKAMFPKLEQIGGQRISGTRTNLGTAKANLKPQADSAFDDFLPARERTPLANVKIGKAQSEAALDPSLDFARVQRKALDDILK